MGATGIQVYAVQGDMAPENMTAQKRREFLDMVKSNGLVISALCGDLGGGAIPSLRIRFRDHDWELDDDT